jgi:hypothetical protein
MLSDQLSTLRRVSSSTNGGLNFSREEPILVATMATDLRQFERDPRACSVEELQARIEALAATRQQLRDLHATEDVLEENRLELARLQWELSHALIQRYLPAA